MLLLRKATFAAAPQPAPGSAGEGGERRTQHARCGRRVAGALMDRGGARRFHGSPLGTIIMNFARSAKTSKEAFRMVSQKNYTHTRSTKYVNAEEDKKPCTSGVLEGITSARLRACERPGYRVMRVLDLCYNRKKRKIHSSQSSRLCSLDSPSTSLYFFISCRPTAVDSYEVHSWCCCEHLGRGPSPQVLIVPPMCENGNDCLQLSLAFVFLQSNRLRRAPLSLRQKLQAARLSSDEDRLSVSRRV